MEATLYTKVFEYDFIIIYLYVDDIISMSTSPSMFYVTYIQDYHG